MSNYNDSGRISLLKLISNQTLKYWFQKFLNFQSNNYNPLASSTNSLENYLDVILKNRIQQLL